MNKTGRLTFFTVEKIDVSSAEFSVRGEIFWQVIYVNKEEQRP